jgi:hypothetical protein
VSKRNAAKYISASRGHLVTISRVSEFVHKVFAASLLRYRLGYVQKCLAGLLFLNRLHNSIQKLEAKVHIHVFIFTLHVPKDKIVTCM